MSGRKRNVDPLYELFEHYLFQRSYEDSSAFTKKVAEEYLAYIHSTAAHVPFHTRHAVLKDLESETHEMLVKKMYGCVRITDYMNYGRVTRVRRKDELHKIEFEPPALPEESPKKD